MKNLICIAFAFFIFQGCSNNGEKQTSNIEKSSYFDYSNKDDQITGGIKMIPI
ncbi:MAG: proline iminopeptidase, partial [Sediminicola sp.]